MEHEAEAAQDLMVRDEAQLPAKLDGAFGERLRRCLGLSARLVCLDGDAAREIAERSRLTGPALALALAGTLGANFPFVSSGLELAFAGVGFLVMIVPMMAIQHAVCKALGGKASYPAFVRTMYATNAVYVTGFLPVIGAPLVALAVLWDCVVTTRAIAAVTGLTITRALAAFLAVTLPMLLVLL